MEIKVVCVGFVIVAICGLVNGDYSNTANHHFYNEPAYPRVSYNRKARSPVVYVADEDDQRVVIITIKKPNFLSAQPSSNNFDSNQNQPQTYDDNFEPSQLPGALSLIEVLRGLGIPGLPPPKYPQGLGGGGGGYGGGIAGAGDISGASQGPAGNGEFGADLAGGIVGGGFGRKRPTAEMPNNKG